MSPLQNDEPLPIKAFFQYAHVYWRIAYREWKGRWDEVGKKGVAEEIFNGLRTRAQSVISVPDDLATYRPKTRCCSISLNHLRDVLMPGWRQTPLKTEMAAIEDALMTFALTRDVDRGLTKFTLTRVFWQWRKDRSLRLRIAYAGEDLKWASSLGLNDSLEVPFFGALLGHRLDQRLWIGITQEPTILEEHSEALRLMRRDAEESPAKWNAFRHFDQLERRSWFNKRLSPDTIARPISQSPRPELGSNLTDPPPQARSHRRRTTLNDGIRGIARKLPQIQHLIRSDALEKAASIVLRVTPFPSETSIAYQVSKEAEFLRIIDASKAFRPKACPRGVTPRQALILAALVGWLGDKPSSWQSPVELESLLAWAQSHYGGPNEHLVIAMTALEEEGLFFQVQHLVFESKVYYCTYDIGFLEELDDGEKHVPLWAEISSENDQEYGWTWHSTGVCSGQGSQSGDSPWGPCLGTNCSWFRSGSPHCIWQLKFNQDLLRLRNAAL